MEEKVVAGAARASSEPQVLAGTLFLARTCDDGCTFSHHPPKQSSLTLQTNKSLTLKTKKSNSSCNICLHCTVKKSYNKLLQDAVDANITVCEVFNGNENWIKPLNTELIPGTCKVAISATPNPTASPTISAPPTTPGTNEPTWTTDDGKKVENICLTKRDPYRTCFQRNLTKDSILRAQYNKGALHNCSEYDPKPDESYIKPYTPPYITEDETLTNITIYFSLLTAGWFGQSLSCDQQLSLEEVALEWLAVSCLYTIYTTRVLYGLSLTTNPHLFNSNSLYNRIMSAGQTPLLQYAHSLMTISFSGCMEMVLSIMKHILLPT
jgi:hypothetical protein